MLLYYAAGWWSIYVEIFSIGHNTQLLSQPNVSLYELSFHTKHLF